ncbi:hypothetical protein CYLTODRAFT_459858 [Cylindrobasidium torrendii FP15055 ss-10]|uniref:Uncharacterized protein n=1 Tax=Cylindrobasidium torrendii FP15055 ss-10 TaxID=1314674 RepID=A0A0D7ATW3_9AGAR|nr:hypothetical protein CYLTODRAFT_459858 [Cylindrobasidium torrendii FP15055 ss-10]
MDIEIAGDGADEPPQCPANPPDGSAKSLREWEIYTKRSVAYERLKLKKQATLKNSRAVQEFSRMQLRQRAAEKEEQESEEMMLIDEETQPTPRKKMKKGALAAAVKKCTVDIIELDEDEESTNPRIPQRLQATRKTPSEMTSEWKKRANAPRMPTAITISQTAAGSTEDFDDSGLGDDDVQDISPPTPSIPVPGASRDGGYSMVAVVRSTQMPVKLKAKPIAQKPKQHVPSSASSSKAKQEIKVEALDLDLDDQDTAQPSTIDVPLFARSHWVVKGLPTFQHYLLASHTPFSEEFGKNSSFVRIAQECIDTAYPGNTYLVRENDAIFTKAISRITDRRSKIGRSGVSYMESVLGPMSPSQRIAYVKWGGNILGPLFYSKPISEECRITDRTHPNFPEPSGFGETEAFKIVFHAAVGDVLEKSQGSWGQALVGAFVMTGASLLRALRMWESGRFIKPDRTNEFSATNTVVQDDISRIITAAKGLFARAWTRIHANAVVKSRIFFF